jgi:hypothetical protein
MSVQQVEAICREGMRKLPGKRNVQYLSLLWPP